MQAHPLMVSLLCALAVSFAVADSAAPLADYMRMRLVNRVVVANNCGAAETFKLISKLSRAGVHASAPARPAYLDLSRRLSTQLTGFILNLDCGEERQFVQESIIEPGNRAVWAVFSSNPAYAIGVMRSFPLTLNSDVVFITNINDTWCAYDVHTIDFRRRTPFNMTFYGIYSSNSSPAQSKKQSPVPHPRSLILDHNRQYSEAELQARWSNLQTEVVARWPRLVASGRLAVAGRWQVALTDTVIRRRWNLRNLINITATYVINKKPPHLTDEAYFQTTRDPHLDASTRYAMHLLFFMRDLNNFKIRYARASLWGRQLPNGSWVGVIDALRRRAADVGAAPMTIKYDRLSAAQYCGLVATTKYSTLFLQPSSVERPTLRVFTAPLAAGAWAAALLLAAGDTALMAITTYLEIKYLKEVGENVTFGSLITNLVNIFYLDGNWPAPKFWGGRWAVLVGGFLGLMVMQFYSASLLAVVLAPPPRPINSLKDMLRSDLVYKAEDVAYHRQFFKEPRETRDPDALALYRDKLLSGALPPFLDVDDGLRRVAAGHFAFQCTASYAYYVVSTWDAALVCALGELDVYPPVQQHLTATKGSPYRKRMLLTVSLARERGLAGRVRPLFYRPRPRCPAEYSARPRPVAAAQLRPLLHMLVALGILAVFILLMEILTAKVHLKIRHVQEVHPFQH